MRTRSATVVLLLVTAALASACLPPPPEPVPPSGPPGVGLLVSGRVTDPAVAALVASTGSRWVRLNLSVGEAAPDFSPFLDQGFDLVVTLGYRVRGNVNITYGTRSQWPGAGFPYLSRDRYIADVRAALTPLRGAVAAGHRVIVECENEVGDAALNPKSRFWRGTTSQYLLSQRACYEAVKGFDPTFAVGLSSFASESLDAARDPSDPRHAYAAPHLERLLRDGAYDVVDLHFYGCVQDIPAKVAWVDARRHPGSAWISTENSGPDPRCPSTPIRWQDDLAAFEAAQADQVSARLDACVEAGGSVCLWFSLFDLVRETDVFNHLGLLDPRVSPPREKPAWDAFVDYQ